MTDVYKNLSVIKQLYGRSYHDEDVIDIVNKDGNIFKMLSEDVRFTSVLEGGYIILPTGEFIPIKDNQDHDAVFSLFIHYYTDAENFIEYNSKDGCSILNELGIVVYFGTKLGYITEINHQEQVDNYLKKSDINKGYGVLSFPKDKKLTNAQKINISQFLTTNLKPLPNGSFREVLSLSYGNLEEGIEYTPEELNSLLTPSIDNSDLTNFGKTL